VGEVRILSAFVCILYGLLYASCYLLMCCLVGPVVILAVGKDRADEIAEDFIDWAKRK
jgi:hypothetical protein